MAGSAARRRERLRYGSDQEPGIRRLGRSRFRFLDERTGRVPSAAAQRRIAALAVPPAWTQVWISADPASHVQATGRDARGRKQYRYHTAFVRDRARDKFAELEAFGSSLGGLRRRVGRDLRRRQADHDLVVATVVALLDRTSLRVGNDEYERSNGTFGLTTLHARHVSVRGTSVRLAFVGKSARPFEVTVDNPRLARIVRTLRDLPGQRLFRYRDDQGELRAVTSGDVNDYLSAHARPGTTAKTFRTWNATALAAELLAETGAGPDGPRKADVDRAISQVAEQLGNTPRVCATSYVHPAVVEAFVDGTLDTSWDRPIGPRPHGLSIAERKLLRLLHGARRRRA